MEEMLSEALAYAQRGWYVFPCREKPGEPFKRNGETITPVEKQPYTPNGLDNATLDLEQIKVWWTKWPNALIGVNAGKSGLFVLDIDRKHVNGLDTYTQWNINDSAGLQSITPSGGTHIIFAGTGKSSTNAKTGIDTRGEGGYFIAPPSKIIEGTHKGEYKRFNDWSKNPGIIPDGLMAKLFPNQTIEYVKGAQLPDGQRKKLSRATLTFISAGAPVGERNSALFKALADFAGCGYTQEEARNYVSDVCKNIGLSRGEVEQVLTHAYAKPRTASIPDSIQEKIMEGGKNVASKITPEEQVIVESALLACLLTNNSLIAVIGDMIGAPDFQSIKNKIIFKAIQEIYNSGMSVDFITVSSHISKSTDKVNLDSLSKLMNEYNIPPESAITYAKIIREKSAIRKIEALMDNKSKYLKDSAIDAIASIEKDIAQIAIYGGIKSTNILTSEQATKYVEDQARRMGNGEIDQLKTGFSDYDYQIGGIYSNELVVIAARTGEGKSALSLSILNDVAIRQKKSVALFSFEMSVHESVSRLVCQLTALPFKKVYQGKLNSDEWKQYKGAMERIRDSTIFFDSSFGSTVTELRSKIRKLAEGDLDLIIIDQLEQIKGYEGNPAYIKFDRIAYDIKDFTTEFDKPIILNHQLNRGITDRKLKNPEPILSDLNQAGEKPANQVWFIMHNKDEHGNILQSKIKMGKNRNGPIMDWAVIYVGERMLFSNPVLEKDKIPYDSSSPGGGNGDYSGQDSMPEDL